MKAYGYIRVSTEGQATDGVSLDAQRAKINAWCAGNGYVLRGVHVDAGLSGKRADNRPGLQAALEEVCMHGGALVVYSLSRLARSTKDALGIAERLDKAGADLVSLTERIDTTSAAGKMVFRMLAVLAEFERDLISERTIAAMAHKRANGQRIGSIPYGFDLDADGVNLRANEREQAVIANIQRMRAEGQTLQEIADALTELGAPTKAGNRQWAHQTVAQILKRPRQKNGLAKGPRSAVSCCKL